MTEPATLGSVGRGGGGSRRSLWFKQFFRAFSTVATKNVSQIILPLFNTHTHKHRKFHILVVYCFFQVAEFRTTQMDNSRDIIIMLFMSLTIARDFYNRNQVQSNYLLKKEYKWIYMGYMLFWWTRAIVTRVGSSYFFKHVVF